jgi:hypothetical protein
LGTSLRLRKFGNSSAKENVPARMRSLIPVSCSRALSQACFGRDPRQGGAIPCAVEPELELDPSFAFGGHTACSRFSAHIGTYQAIRKRGGFRSWDLPFPATVSQCAERSWVDHDPTNWLVSAPAPVFLYDYVASLRIGRAAAYLGDHPARRQSGKSESRVTYRHLELLSDLAGGGAADLRQPGDHSAVGLAQRRSMAWYGE